MKLKGKFITFQAMAFFIILAASYGLFEVLRSEVVSGLGTDFAANQTLYNRAKALQPLVREIALATKLADSSTIKDWAQNEYDPEKKRAALRELEDYRRFFADGSWFFAFGEYNHYYFDDSSKAQSPSEPRYSLDPTDKENRWYFGTIESGESYRINVDYDEKLKLTKVWINVVIRQDGRPLGIIGTGIDLSNFLREAISANQPGMTSMFIESHGAIQAHSDIDHIDFRTISKSEKERKTIFTLLDKQGDAAKLAGLMEKLKNGGKEEVGTLVVKIGGMDHLIGLAYLSPIDWFNVTILDTEKIIGKERFLPFAILIISTLLLLSISVGYLLNKYIIRRILSLDAATVEMAGGIEALGNGHGAADELGRLEENFRIMADKISLQTSSLKQQVAEGSELIAQKESRLVETDRELRILKGLLPTCMYCKKIRDETGRWNSLEEYITKHSEAEFSHGICPDCVHKVYGSSED